MELLARTGAGPARHQTLRASVEWSHQLLSERERAVFRRLAVFAGGWPLEGAETVCSLPPVEQGEIAGLLAGLVDKSLVQADHTPAGSRYRLLEVIRAFASERLAEAGELEQVRERHAGYYTGLAERATAEVWGPAMPGWVPRMDQEADNLRAARRWCVQDQRPRRSARHRRGRSHRPTCRELADRRVLSAERPGSTPHPSHPHSGHVDSPSRRSRAPARPALAGVRMAGSRAAALRFRCIMLGRCQ